MELKKTEGRKDILTIEKNYPIVFIKITSTAIKFPKTKDVQVPRARVCSTKFLRRLRAVKTLITLGANYGKIHI